MSEAMLIASLVRGFDHVVRDPVWGDLRFSEAYHEVASSTPFVVADGIRQLGPVPLLYPGATHTRKAHSLGVFHIARRLALSLAERGQIDFVGREGVRSFLAAALCHDIGHYPYAHSLKELPLARHETLAAELLATEPLRSLVGECGADPDLAAAIVDGDRPCEDDREACFFRSLLSGVLDPDKIDYLTRDAFFCGVPYGVQDADFVLRKILVGPGDRPGVDHDGVMSVEGLLFSKYLMYRSVYWHRTVRSATSMMRKSVQMALDSGGLAPERLYGLTDEGFRTLMTAAGDECSGLANSVFSGRVYALATETAFDPANPIHVDLLELDRRKEAESTLAAAAGIAVADLVIDIPEPIGFETELPVFGPGGEEAFGQATTVFRSEVISGFSGALRKVRIFAKNPTSGLSKLSSELLS